MGIQANCINTVDSMICNSIDYLKGAAEKQYVKKYFEVDLCCPDVSKRELMYNYMIQEYISGGGDSIVDYINKRLSGEIGYEYKRRKAIQDLERIELKWECNDMYDDNDANCCEWKSLEW